MERENCPLECHLWGDLLTQEELGKCRGVERVYWIFGWMQTRERQPEGVRARHFPKWCVSPNVASRLNGIRDQQKQHNGIILVRGGVEGIKY